MEVLYGFQEYRALSSQDVVLILSSKRISHYISDGAKLLTPSCSGPQGEFNAGGGDNGVASMKAAGASRLGIGENSLDTTADSSSSDSINIC